MAGDIVLISTSTVGRGEWDFHAELVCNTCGAKIALYGNQRTGKLNVSPDPVWPGGVPNCSSVCLSQTLELVGLNWPRAPQPIMSWNGDVIWSEK